MFQNETKFSYFLLKMVDLSQIWSQILNRVNERNFHCRFKLRETNEISFIQNEKLIFFFKLANNILVFYHKNYVDKLLK